MGHSMTEQKNRRLLLYLSLHVTVSFVNNNYVITNIILAHCKYMLSTSPPASINFTKRSIQQKVSRKQILLNHSQLLPLEKK